MNRAEMTRRVLLLEAAAAELKGRAAAVRADLNADARAELAEQGTRATWRTDLGTWSLPVSEEAPTVTDAAALVAWCKERYPTEVVEVVNPAFQTVLLSRLEPVGEVVMDPATAEVVPGLGVRPGGVPQALRFRPNAAAQAVAAEALGSLVDQLAAGLGIETGDE
jgi:hypothetical protein